ncbi:MAG: MATE family efflux transporter, partial [Bacteroidota bacterium]
MKVKTDYKSIWELSYPIMLGGLATTLLNLTDTAFVSRLGETELASMALTTIFYFVVVMIAFSVGTGLQILMSRRAGEGDRIEIGRIFDNGFLILAAASALFTIILYAFTPLFFESILTSPGIITASNDYLSLRSFGIPFAFIMVCFRSFYIAIGQTRIIIYTSIIMLIMNAVLDYMLIFGKFGMPVMGIKGAALASVISE